MRTDVNVAYDLPEKEKQDLSRKCSALKDFGPPTPLGIELRMIGGIGRGVWRWGHSLASE